MNQVPIFLNGGFHQDERGILKFVNDFDFETVKRFYLVQNESTNVVRAWQAHKYESKYFYIVSGSFTICVVKIDNWEKPSIDLPVQVFQLSDKESKILFVPCGYANGFKANQPNSKLIIFSDKSLDLSEKDNFRFDPNLWLDWSNIS